MINTISNWSRQTTKIKSSSSSSSSSSSRCRMMMMVPFSYSCSNSNNKRHFFSLLLLLISLQQQFVFVLCQQTEWLDRFTYEDETIDRTPDVTASDGDDTTGIYKDYAPQQWNLINCDEQNDLEQCIAYRDKWLTGRGWSIEQNYCRWCPHPRGSGGDGSTDAGNCGRHHQSPIILDRTVGMQDSDAYHECIDVHWMKYEDSFCTLDQLVEQQAFTIERHALRVSNPVLLSEDLRELRSACHIPGKGRRFGRIDYSKGFSDWWFLSHIDIHVPGEHAQAAMPSSTNGNGNGNDIEYKLYDGEIQLHHWYSVSAEEAGVDNELGTVAIFLQVYDDAPPYVFLDKVICQWRRYEYSIRQECGLDPIPSTYPGCFPLTGRHDRFKKKRRRKERNLNNNNKKKGGNERRLQDVTPLQTIQDAIIYNSNIHDDDDSHTNTTTKQQRYKIHMDEVNWEPPEEKDWDQFIKDQSDLMKLHDIAYYKSNNKDEFVFNHTEAIEEHIIGGSVGGDDDEDDDDEDAQRRRVDRKRRLIEAAEIEWFNYFPMLGVRTEYYFRYSGSQTIPPCYGNFVSNSREGTLHWRVMKDPIRIHRRQLVELKRLLRERIAPITDPVNPCEPDTAVKVDPDTGDVFGARPLQYFHPAHFKVFCECVNWPSKWPEDVDWCTIEDQQQRFFDHPYNFHTDGF